MASAIVVYHQISPNQNVAGCLNTTEGGDGVVFKNVEPLVDEHCFIGRQSIYEAVSELEGVTVNQVKKLLTATKEVTAAKKEMADLRAQLTVWAEFADRMENAGLVLPALE